MKITEIRVKLVDGDPTRQRLRAFCSLTFDNAFVVRDLKVLEGNQGYFVAMPSRKMAGGDFRDVAHPLTSEFRNKIKEAVFSAFEKLPPEEPAEA